MFYPVWLAIRCLKISTFVLIKVLLTYDCSKGDTFISFVVLVNLCLPHISDNDLNCLTNLSISVSSDYYSPSAIFSFTAYGNIFANLFTHCPIG